MKDEELQEQLIKILGLEKNLHDQLVPSNFEDFQSDWTFTVKALTSLVAKEVIKELRHIEKNASGGGNWRRVIISRLEELEAQQSKGEKL